MTHNSDFLLNTLKVTGFLFLVLCPPGSLSSIPITLPPPPDQKLDVSGGDSNSNQAFLDTIMWPSSGQNDRHCQPCPACTFSEAMARPSCLPCPAWHSTPIFGSVPGEGGEWIDTVCPRAGRDYVILGDFVDSTFGQLPVGDFFAGLSEMTRVSIFVGLGVGLLFSTLGLVVFVYWLVDAGRMLSNVSNMLRPLYIEAALVTKTMRRTEKKRSNHAAIRMKEIITQQKQEALLKQYQ